MKKTSWQLFHLADISHTQFIICLEGDSGIELKAEDVIIDNNISENWLQKQILLCMAQSVSQILLEQFILAWATLACSNTMAALCSTLWPQSVSHKKCWHIAEQVYFYPLFVLSLNHVT